MIFKMIHITLRVCVIIYTLIMLDTFQSLDISLEDRFTGTRPTKTNVGLPYMQGTSEARTRVQSTWGGYVSSAH